MIRYNLRCERGHPFESWFQSSSAYDQQVRRKLVTCPECGTAKVEKAIMAPQVVARKGREKPAPAAVPAETPPSESTSLMMAQERELRTKLKELRDHIVKSADNVGDRFPNEARKMHYGETAARGIRGQVTREETEALLDEGIEVMALPILESLKGTLQ